MNEQVKEYLEKYSNEIVDLFNEVRDIILIVFHLCHRKLCGRNCQAIM